MSAASFWEMSIQEALGRLDLGAVDPILAVEEDGFLELPIRARHALAAGRLPTGVRFLDPWGQCTYNFT